MASPESSQLASNAFPLITLSSLQKRLDCPGGEWSIQSSKKLWHTVTEACQISKLNLEARKKLRIESKTPALPCLLLVVSGY